MTNNEARIKRLEDELRQAKQLIRDLQIDVGKLKQDAWAASPLGSGGGSGSAPLFCILSSGISASGTIGSGSPAGPLASQTVYSIQSGAFTSISSSADVYNGLPNAISSGAECIVEANADGSYSVIAVAC